MIEVKASMAGNLWKLNVALGDQVKAGDEVAVLESMKMEIPITCDVDGKVQDILKKENDFVNEGEPILILEEI